MTSFCSISPRFYRDIEAKKEIFKYFGTRFREKKQGWREGSTLKNVFTVERVVTATDKDIEEVKEII